MPLLLGAVPISAFIYKRSSNQTKPHCKDNTFSPLYGKNTESPWLLINLLDILTVNHIYELQALT